MHGIILASLRHRITARFTDNTLFYGWKTGGIPVPHSPYRLSPPPRGYTQFFTFRCRFSHTNVGWTQIWHTWTSSHYAVSSHQLTRIQQRWQRIGLSQRWAFSSNRACRPCSHTPTSDSPRPITANIDTALSVYSEARFSRHSWHLSIQHARHTLNWSYYHMCIVGYCWLK